MVRGIEKFKEYFKDYTGQYVFIGGTACDITLQNLGQDFRATKDLDMVLIIENLQEEFVTTFIKFIEDGKYSHRKKGTDRNQFYRFEKPSNPDFPAMIELFAKKPSYIARLDSNLAPIHISNDVISLSAILLNDEYYTLLKNGIKIIEKISVLNLEYIILFKIKAYLDLNQRKEDGESIDSKTIKKHKKDVFKLAENISIDSIIDIPEIIKQDVTLFIHNCEENILNVNEKDVLDILKKVFKL